MCTNHRNVKCTEKKEEKTHTETNLFFQSDSRLAVQCVWLIVIHAVLDNPLKVFVKIVKRAILVTLHLGFHGREIHGMVNILQVVWHLSKERKQNIIKMTNLYLFK